MHEYIQNEDIKRNPDLIIRLSYQHKTQLLK